MNARTLMQDDIYERLKERILEGAFPPGSFLPSENGLIEHFKVSRTPVRAALTRLSVEGVLRPLNGKGWQVQPINETRRAQLAVLMGPNYRRNIFDLAAKKLLDKGIKSHFHFEDFSRSVEDTVILPKLGGILAITGVPFPDGFVSSLKKARIPVVCAGLQSREGYDTISTDNMLAIEKILELLKSAGHRKVLFIDTEVDDLSFRMRAETFTRRSGEIGILGESVKIKLNWVSPKGDAEKILRRLRNSRFDAVLAVSEPIANSLFVVLVKEGIRVPADISLVCVGEGFPNPDSPSVYYGIESFAPVSHDWPSIMQVTADRLLSRINGDSSPAGMTLLPPIIREVKSSIKDKVR